MADDKVKKSKDALKSADDFTMDVEKKLPSRFAPKAPVASAPAAPDKPAEKGMTSGLEQEAKSAKDSIEAKKAMVDAVTTDAPKMHKGGDVKKDGIHNLKKNEVVVDAKTSKKMGGHNGLMDALNESADDKDKKGEKKKTSDKHNPAHKSKHKVKSVHVRKAENGMIARNEYEPDEEGKMKEPTEHVLPDMDSLHGHMDDHMSADMGAAGPDAAAGAPAPAAQA